MTNNHSVFGSGSAWRLFLLGLLALVFSAFGPSCSCDDKSSNGTECAAGTEGCLCTEGSCETGLECDRGYCVPSECPGGTEDCPCLDDGTCNVAAGEDLVCQNNICVSTGGVPEGQAGGPCYPNGSCDGALECNNNICEEPGCPNGDLGCACGPGGVCSDEEATCNTDNVCARAGCDGQENCGCVGGATCDEGLSCQNNVCRAPNGLSISVTHADVRSCDVLMMEGARKVDNAVYTAQVIGRTLKKSPRVGFAFAARENQPLSGRLATVTFEGTEAVSEDMLSPISVTCYGADGQEIDSHGLTIAP